MSTTDNPLKRPGSGGPRTLSDGAARQRHGLKRLSNVTMSGVIFGGATGAFIGGPIGAVLGIAIGGVAGEAIERYFPSANAEAERG